MLRKEAISTTQVSQAVEYMKRLQSLRLLFNKQGDI